MEKFLHCTSSTGFLPDHQGKEVIKLSRTIIALLGTIIAISFVSMASAQSISDEELLSAASQVITATVDQTNELGQSDQLASVSKSVSEVSAKTAIEGAEVEGAEVGDTNGTEVEGAESADIDGPGGSTHEFDGEEEGDH